MFTLTRDHDDGFTLRMDGRFMPLSSAALRELSSLAGLAIGPYETQSVPFSFVKAALEEAIERVDYDIACASEFKRWLEETRDAIDGGSSVAA